jgi:hydrogenase maturation protease
MMKAEPRILVAGIGNIFLGDDAFGVEVAQQLMGHNLPENVRVVDFGIRSYDLAFAILEEYEATILVDATAQGGTPGTLYLMEPDLDDLDQFGGQMVDGHSMNPVAALQLVKTFGGRPRRLFLVGCEPATLECEEGEIGLSQPVQAAVAGAIEMVESLVDKILNHGAYA